MSKQLSVQTQNAQAGAQIARIAGWFAQQPSPLPWLIELLAERDLASGRGILVRYEDIPDQGGTLCKGVWLTPGRRFWQFEVLVPSSKAAVVSVEKFREITEDVPVSSHARGIGKSFGALAVEHLEALQHER